MLRLKNKVKGEIKSEGWGGIGVVSNRYLYEVCVENGDVVGFQKKEVMSRIVELNKQNCKIAIKPIS